ncbi:MAG: DEAD/DEAH box helicase family protein [Chloroflexota bacterium]|nr:DEAD/DEAH box helicase family protein [Chloroflexota bacterium]
MEFQFDPNQAYQLAAIQAVVDLFAGQTDLRLDNRPVVDAAAGVVAVANRLLLDSGSLLANLQAVQTRNGLPAGPELLGITETVDSGHGPQPFFFPNYSVEMETGTGKTYCYLRTVLQLHQQYGYRKFIIVVPSVAVREGVLKSLAITERHLLGLYSNPAYNYYPYDSGNLARLGSFAASPGIEILVMTLDSFNKSSNVLNRGTETMPYPLRHLQASRPILILDEPQNMESAISKQALAGLTPLFALRYSATHRDPYNAVYRLTPYQAYRDGLVKKIEVASVLRETDANRPYLRLVSVESTSRTITAHLALYKRLTGGRVKETTVKVGVNDDLAIKADNPLYADYRVGVINRGYGAAGGNSVRFTNGVELREGQPLGADRERVMERQIRYAVEEHFRKQAAYRAKGIKVLTLFFIDRVASYTDEEGPIRQMFLRAFSELVADHPEWPHRDVAQVHNGYFAKTRKGGSDQFVDSSGDSKEDNDAYRLIMQDKERLLAFTEPTAFLFSHSALREGWDNPNVFQICTLNQTTSETKKRQEIGRGMRLAVDTTGARLTEADYNVLTVVANESYESYVAGLQREIESEYGPDGTPPPPTNAAARTPNQATRRDSLYYSPEFQALWQRISRKTRYAVQIDTDRLIADVLRDLATEEANIHGVRIQVRRAAVQVGTSDTLTTMVTGSTQDEELTIHYDLPNLIEIMTNLLEYTTPPILLTRNTLLRICDRATPQLQAAALTNPYEFAATVVRLAKQKLAEQLVAGVQYTPVDEWYDQSLIEPQLLLAVGKPYSQSPLPTGIGTGRCLYDKTTCDSGVEVKFAAKLEQNNCVRLYVKLPARFKVATPVGNYNPDWAIVFEPHNGHGESQQALLYLVRETKDTTDINTLPEEQRWKVQCGAAHFRAALHVDYRVVTDESELPDEGWSGGLPLPP